MSDALVTLLIDAKPGKSTEVVWAVGALEGAVTVDPTKTRAGLIWAKFLAGEADSALEKIRAMPAVEGAERGDMPVELSSPTTKNLTLQRAALQTEAGHAKWLSYQPKASFEWPNWWELPRDESYVEESARMGEHVVIAVCDTGIDTTHPEFTNSGRTITLLRDEHEDGPGIHGTWCASLIAGRTVGFCPDADILDLKAFSAGGGAGLQDIFRCLEALRDWIDADNLGATQKVVLSMSLGGYYASNVYTSLVNELWERGVFIFAASGNDNVNFDTASFDFYPANALPEGAVGATHLNGERTNFSSHGAVVSLYHWGFYPIAAGLAYDTSTGFSHAIGTSFACPIAAGAFATWVSAYNPPSGIANTRAMQARWRDDFCVKGKVTDRYGLDLSQKAVGLADNSPISNYVSLLPGSTIELAIFYDVREDYLTVYDIELIIEYDP